MAYGRTSLLTSPNGHKCMSSAGRRAHNVFLLAPYIIQGAKMLYMSDRQPGRYTFPDPPGVLLLHMTEYACAGLWAYVSGQTWSVDC